MRAALAALFLIAVGAPLGAQAPAPLLEWADLLPKGEADTIARLERLRDPDALDHFGADQAAQIQTYSVVEALDGRRVRMNGYVVPFDFTADRRVSRFLLVPFVGACIRVPPPPPNQLVYVRAETAVAIDGLWDPVEVTGLIRLERTQSDLGDTAYVLDLTELRPYQG